MIKNQTNRINKEEVLSYISEQTGKGLPTPTIRELRDHFKCGSYSTFSSILQKWETDQEGPRKALLMATSFSSEDLEGRLLEAVLPVLNARMQEIVSEVTQKAQEPQKELMDRIEELTKEIEELERENSVLRAELTKAAEEREATTAKLVDKVEQLTRRFADEKSQLIAGYEEKLLRKDELNERLDALFNKLEQPLSHRSGASTSRIRES